MKIIREPGIFAIKVERPTDFTAEQLEFLAGRRVVQQMADSITVYSEFLCMFPDECGRSLDAEATCPTT